MDASDGRTWSRLQLDAHADAWIAAAGRRLAGETVVFAEPNGPAWFQVFLALLKMGAVPAPLEPSEPEEARLSVAAAVKARFLWSRGFLHGMRLGSPAPRDGRRILKLTSGTTGKPKALAFTDAQMLADGRQICAAMGIVPKDINLGVIPLGHSYGLGNLVLPLLAQGTPIVSGLPPFPHAMAAGIGRWRPTVFPAVPALLRALAETEVDPAMLGSLRTVISAGSELPVEVAQAFHRRFGLKVHSFYGSSETGGISYDRSGDAALTGRSVGTPLKGVRLAFGSAGRFTVSSAAVFTLGNRSGGRGFGRHAPSDFARPGPRGELVLLGRAGRQIKLAGRRFNPSEMERAIRRLPGILDAFVAAHPHRPHALAAAVAGAVSPESVRLALRGKVAAWKIPGKLVVLPRFPVTARGKTDTRKLLAMLGG
jgi:acyl-coenzyme A synthetase/AMP-(fatty) acid ligase